MELVESVAALVNGEGIEAWKQNPWIQWLLRWWAMLGIGLADLKSQIDWKKLWCRGPGILGCRCISSDRGGAESFSLLPTLFSYFSPCSFFSAMERASAIGCAGSCRWIRNIKKDGSTISLTPLQQWFTVVWSLRRFRAFSGPRVLGAGSPILCGLGVVTAFAALLPVGVSTFVTGPAAIYLFLQGDIVRGVRW